MEKNLPPIPAKRYFTIGEVGALCGIKPHVLRYWEQEFTQLRPMKRRGNRRYYQHHEVLIIRRIQDLLYDQGFTINGARNKLQEMAQNDRHTPHTDSAHATVPHEPTAASAPSAPPADAVDAIQDESGAAAPSLRPNGSVRLVQEIHRELLEIRELLIRAS